MSALRPALRIARRELWRRKGRTILVVLLVAVPVAAVLAGTIVARTVRPPTEAALHNALGGADARWDSGGALVPDEGGRPAAGARLGAGVEDQVPGSSSALLRSAGGSVATPAGDRNITVVAGPVAGPLASPRYEVLEGRLPTAPGEVALTPTLGDELGASVGDLVDIPELDLRGTVVGVADRALWSDARELLAPELPDLEPSTVDAELLIDLPTGREAEALRQVSDLVPGVGGQLHASPLIPGAAATANTYVPGADAAKSMNEAALGSFLGEALVFVVLGLIISVAFTVGARRQIRMLGLVAANGGSPAMVRSVVVAQGLWCGLVGAALGVALAFGGLAVSWPFVSAELAYRPSWWTMSLADADRRDDDGVGAAVASSWLPARTVSRQSVLQALAGRRPLPPLRPRLAALGGVVAAAGLASLALATALGQVPRSSRGTFVIGALALVGGLAVLAGTVIGAHGLVAVVGRLGARAGGSVRLAARALARQRTRYGSVVAGVAAVTAIVLLIAGSMEPYPIAVAANPTAAPWSPPDDQVTVTPPLAIDGRVLGPEDRARLQPVLDVLPGAEVIPLQSFQLALDHGDQAAYGAQRRAAVATPELIEHLDLPADVRQKLASGRLVGVADPAELIGQRWESGAGSPTPVPLEGVRMFDQGNLGGFVDVDWVTPDQVGTKAADLRDLGAWFLATPEHLAELGIPEPPIDLIQVLSPGPISDEQRAALQALRPGGAHFWLRGRPDPAQRSVNVSYLAMPSSGWVRGDPARLIQLATAGASLLLTALIVALGVALAAADSKEERDALEALGAPPAMMRRAEGIKAATVAALGALAALVAAGLPALVVALSYQWSREQPAPLAPNDGEWWRFVPWSTIAWVVIGIPVVLGLVTMLGSGLRARLRPVAASRFSFD